MARSVVFGLLLSLPLLAFGCSLANAPDEVNPGKGNDTGGAGGGVGGGTSSSTGAGGTGGSGGSGGLPPGCGNGQIDMGETCDPCPANCDDSDPCTTDTLESGTAETCTLACKHAPPTICSTTGDGCCPFFCNANDDADCSMCGDGILSAGEICDGNCPQSCDDNNACTVDTMMGSPGTCDVMCTNMEMQVCIPGDGCCAPGCDAQGDPDCCGNPGGGSMTHDNGAGTGVKYCYNAGDSAEMRAQKACESHFGVGQCCVIMGGYQSMQYGQCNMDGGAGTYHFHWDNHPDGHCAPNYIIGDVVSPGWCGTVMGNLMN